MRKKQFSDFSFQNFFRFSAKIFSDFRPENFKKMWKLPSECPEEQFVAWNFFLKIFESFRIFCKNLWHGSQKSIYVSRVKNAEKTSFLLFSFQNLFDFWAKIFQTFGQKTSRKCENYLLRVHRNNLWLYIFLKSFEPFWIFYRNLWHGSQNSIYVSRVKILEETDFLFFFSEVFRILSENFSDFQRKIFKKLSKLPSTCPEEQFVGWIFFLKFWIVSYFLQKPLALFSKFYLRVQSKNCGKNSFFCFHFGVFSIFEQKFFRLLAKKPQKFVKTNLCVSRGTICGLKIFLKVLNPFGFSAETFGMFLKILSKCPE